MIKVSFKKRFKRGHSWSESSRLEGAPAVKALSPQAGRGTPKEGPEGFQAQKESSLVRHGLLLPIKAWQQRFELIVVFGGSD